MVRGEGVAAHDVELDELRPPLVAFDAGLAGQAGGGDFCGVGFEVLGADPGAAPDQRAFPDFGRGDAQDQGKPPGSGVHPGLEADPLDAVPGQDAPDPARRSAAGSTGASGPPWPMR